MMLIAIDGACRRNGQPDCTAAGGVFYRRLHADGKSDFGVMSAYEYNSTNQRGELLALLKALDFIAQSGDGNCVLVTDSEYIYNALSKCWYDNWHNKGWVTASGAPVKNKDIWLEVKNVMNKCHAHDLKPAVFHIKGHCIPFGRATATKLLGKDPTGEALHEEVLKKFDACAPTRTDTFDAAQALSMKNNGFEFPATTFKNFVVANVMADAVATKIVEEADSRRKR